MQIRWRGSSTTRTTLSASSDQFHIGDLTFGILICNDSNYIEPAKIMASQGATALFIPTNNGLPPEKADAAAHARNVDIARAIENSVSVSRADVAGRTAGMVSYGSSWIVDSDGTVLQSAQRLSENLIVADLETSPRERRRGRDASRNSGAGVTHNRRATGATSKIQHPRSNAQFLTLDFGSPIPYK